MEELSDILGNASAETLDTFATLGSVSRVYFYTATIVGVFFLLLSTVSLLKVKQKKMSSPNYIISLCISLALFFSAFVNTVSSVMYTITWEHDQSTGCSISVVLLIAVYILHLTAVLLFLFQRSELVRVSRAAKESRFVRVLRKVTLMATLGTPPGGVTLAIAFARGSVYQGRCLMVYNPNLPVIVLTLNTILSAQYLLLFMIPLASHWSTSTHTNTHRTVTLETKASEGKIIKTSNATSSSSLMRMARKNLIMSIAAITTSLITFTFNCLIVRDDPIFYIKAHLFGNIDMGANGVIMLCSTSIWVPGSVKKKLADIKQYYSKLSSSQVAPTHGITPE